jgi:hypothetical protein
MPPPEPTAGKNRRAGKDGGGVAVAHSSCGSRSGWGEELLWQGKLGSGGGVQWLEPGRSSLGGACTRFADPPPPPPEKPSGQFFGLIVMGH